MRPFSELEAQHGLPSGLLNAVMKQESGGNTRAVSPKGARGAFQFMPDTAKQYGVNVNDMASSAAGAAKMYADLLKQNGGDLPKALAGYNWGQGNVQRKGMERMPAETRQYIQKVTANMQPQIDKSKIVWDAPQIDKSQIVWDEAPAAQKSDRTSARLDTGRIKAAGETIVDSAAGLGTGVGQVALGAQKYLGKFANAIGADTVGNWLVNDATQGREKLTRELAPHKARSPIAATVGEVGGNVAATLPVGGAFAQAPKLLAKAPMLASQAPRLNAAATALRTGGFRTGLPAATTLAGKAGQLGLRSGAAALPAYTAQSLIDGNTNNAVTAAAIGGALPPGLKIAGEAGKLIKKGTGGLVKHTLGATTGTGAESVSAAYNAGKNKSTAFLDNMRGNTSFDDVVDQAKGALQNMRIERGNAYRSGMVDIAGDKAVVDFKPISEAVSKISQMGSYKGQQINKNAAGTVSELSETVDNWASLNPAEYHTPEGLDALKQAVGDIRDTTQFGTAARRSADAVYNSIKDQITAQAPTYAKVMKDYSEASAALQETEKALSLGNKAAKDTAVRKLQSLMRNNAQTNYGNRLDIAKNLEEKGGVELLPAIAGQSMNSLTPRGITGAIQKGGALLGAVGSGGASIPLTIAAAPFTSPRLVGESLYGLGRLTGAAGSVVGQGGNALSRIAGKHPELLEKSKNALYRATPVMATSQRN